MNKNKRGDPKKTKVSWTYIPNSNERFILKNIEEYPRFHRELEEK